MVATASEAGTCPARMKDLKIPRASLMISRSFSRKLTTVRLLTGSMVTTLPIAGRNANPSI